LKKAGWLSSAPAQATLILQHTIRGCDAKRIAEITNISVLTVRKHISHIYQKLHVNSKAQVMNLAHQRKWFN
jgi:DNA-binding NarL/FixJ family response regulator